MKELTKSQNVVFNPKIKSLQVIDEQIFNLLEKKSGLLKHELTKTNELILDINNPNDSKYDYKHLYKTEWAVQDSHQRLKKIIKNDVNLQSLYDDLPDLCRIIDTNGVIIDCNISYLTNLGYSKLEVIGSSIFDHTAGKSKVALFDSLEFWKKNGYVKNREIWMKRKNGTTFPALVSAEGLYDDAGKLIGSNTVIREISELHKVRTELENRENTIRKQNQQLKKLDKEKSEFITMITHELKTPLVPIKGYIDLLLSNQFGALDEKQHRALKTINQSTESMINLVSDILDVHKMELGEFQLQKKIHDPGEIVIKTIQKVKAQADDHGVVITTDIAKNILCLCDEEKTQQILINLLTNAIKFCPKNNGKIHVKLHLEEHFTKIIVKDNGVGIQKSKLDKIFTKFYQIDLSSTREHGGIGLGLSVCKCIAELHGGKIWAKSAGTNHGAEIHLLLPNKKVESI